MLDSGKLAVGFPSFLPSARHSSSTCKNAVVLESLYYDSLLHQDNE